MKHVKIIGIGSPFGPDQLGQHAIAHLQQHFADDTTKQQSHAYQLSFIYSDRPGLRLLDMLKDSDAAILIDAINQPEQTGQVLQLERADLVTHTKIVSSHAIGVSETLSLGAALGELPEELVLFGICVDCSKQEPIPNTQIDLLCEYIRTFVSNI